MKLLLFAIAALGLFGVSSTRAAPFSFGVVGDVPYGMTEVTQLREMIEEMNRAPLAFATHVGDIKDGHTPCIDAELRARKQDFEASVHPFVFVPGDNEWTDCIRAEAGGHDPQERLAKLREVFFSDRYSLGKSKLELTRQSEDARFAAYRENARWRLGGVMFVTLNLTGSNNGWGLTSGNPEFFDRLRANTHWLAQAFELARDERAPAVVIFMQANPQFEQRWDRRRGGHRRDGYAEFKQQLVNEATRFERPVLVVHGDSHRHRFDRPVMDFARGRAVDNVLRLETFGSPLNGWVKVTVDAQAHEPFRIQPHRYPPAPRNDRERLKR